VEARELSRGLVQPAADKPVDINMCHVCQISMETIDFVIRVLRSREMSDHIAYPEDKALIEVPWTITEPLGADLTMN
jgi:hypothetical protein